MSFIVWRHVLVVASGSTLVRCLVLLKIPYRIIYERNYMARRQIFSLSERESLLALPDDELMLTRITYFCEHDLALISAHRKPASRFGFAVLLCYLKNVGFAPDKKNHPLMLC